MAQTNYIQLPEIAKEGNMSLEEAISLRRSQRSFSQKKVGMQQIGQLLWAGQGITLEVDGWKFRSAPSAGALYPMELYVLTEEAVYQYVPDGHKLKLCKETDMRSGLSKAALSQQAVKQAPLDIVICAVYSRLEGKYGQRSVRYAHIEAGHVAQNIHLEAVSLGMGSVSIGAFDDKNVQKVLALPKDHEPLYIIPLGYLD